MKQRPRIYYTENQRALMWDRWEKGESLFKSRSCLIEAILRFTAFWPRQGGYVRRNVAVRH